MDVNFGRISNHRNTENFYNLIFLKIPQILPKHVYFTNTYEILIACFPLSLRNIRLDILIVIKV